LHELLAVHLQQQLQNQIIEEANMGDFENDVIDTLSEIKEIIEKG
jgi:hypothetical protein